LKKNYFLRVAAVLLVCAMFGLCIVPGTMGRYGAVVPVNSPTVRAGLFEVKIKRGNDWVSITQGTTGQSFPINLYETLKQAYDDEPGSPANHPLGNDSAGAITYDKKGYIDDEPEGLIAPGCGGQFKIAVKNFSEVEVAVEVTADEIDFQVLLQGLGMENMIQWWDEDEGEWTDEFPGIPSADALANLEPLGTLLSEKTYTFTWRWLFERDYDATWHTGSQSTPRNAWANASDVADTNLGRDSKEEPVTLELELSVYVSQVD